MKKQAMLGVVLSLVATLTVSAADSLLMVVPVRQRTMDFAFDVSRMKPVTLVAYDTRNPGKPALNVWDREHGIWEALSPEEYAAGSFLPSSVKQVVIVGPVKEMPAELEKIAWAPVDRVTALSFSEMANKLDATLKFSGRQWQYLADEYGFTIQDLNTDRRRYGKYGPPGQKSKMPPKVETETVLPLPVTLPQETPVEVAPAPAPVTGAVVAPVAPAPVAAPAVAAAPAAPVPAPVQKPENK
jgi:hypothetical protein